LDEFGKICPDVKRCVTTTTREPRECEIDGVDYNFVSHEEFRRHIEHGDFLEYAEFYGNFYGTPRQWVEEKLADGVDVILKIEVQGGQAVKKKKPEAVMVFLVAPSLEELERRLRGRGTDADDVVAGRLNRALAELEHISDYQYLIVNDSVAKAAEELKAVINAEHSRIKQ
jgi:guanylate kinase